MPHRPDQYGTPCGLSYDHPGVVAPGDVVRSEAGACWLVLGARRVQGRYPDRWSLDCVRLDPAEVPADAVVHPLYWYPRRPANH